MSIAAIRHMQRHAEVNLVMQHYQSLGLECINKASNRWDIRYPQTISLATAVHAPKVITQYLDEDKFKHWIANLEEYKIRSKTFFTFWYVPEEDAEYWKWYRNRKANCPVYLAIVSRKDVLEQGDLVLLRNIIDTAFTSMGVLYNNARNYVKEIKW